MIKRHPIISFVAPFAAFIILLGLKNSFPFAVKWEYPVRFLIVSTILLFVSPGAISWRPSRPSASIVLGVVLFAIWIGPDLLWPAYRTHWLFQNPLSGKVASSLPPGVTSDPVFLIFRVLGTMLLVPIIEELFWRGWLMRYIINPDFQKVQIGAYTAAAIWFTAIVFAVEHGPFWDVGLVAGLVFGFWVVRTRNLADCMITHGVTNACLALYVIQRQHFEYWL